MWYLIGRKPPDANGQRVCTKEPEIKVHIHSLCATRKWEREWYGVATPNIFSGHGVILFTLGTNQPLLERLRKWLRQIPWGPLIGI